VGVNREDLEMSLCVIENNLKHMLDFLDEIVGKVAFLYFKVYNTR